MRASLLVAAVILQATTTEALSLRERWQRAEQNANATRSRVKLAEESVRENKQEVEEASQAFEVKTNDWAELQEKADALKKPRNDAEKVIQEYNRLSEALTAARRAHVKAKEEYLQTLLTTRYETSASRKTWLTELYALTPKADLEQQVNHLKDSLSRLKASIDEDEKKHADRKKEFTARNCDRIPGDRTCQTTNLVMQDLEKFIASNRTEKAKLEQELRSAQQLFENYDPSAEKLLQHIKRAEDRVKTAEETLEECRQHTSDAAAAEESAAAAVRKLATVKGEADALLAAPERPEVVEAVEAAHNAEWAKDNAKARRTLAEEEIARSKDELSEAEKALVEAQSAAAALKKEVKDNEKEGISTGSIAGVAAVAAVIVGMIVGGILVFLYRDRVFKRGRGIEEQAKAEIEMQGGEGSPFLAFQQPKILTEQPEIPTDSGVDSMLTGTAPESSVFARSITDQMSDNGAGSVASTPSSPPWSCKFESEFVVKRILGVGGFGCVFEAHNKNDDSDYAVKRIAVSISEKDKTLSEARILAKMKHAGIVRYYHVWVE
ncbi:hypothetical protein PMAYCL1PPCAC_14161, partial [Pristionchus mayeri]